MGEMCMLMWIGMDVNKKFLGCLMGKIMLVIMDAYVWMNDHVLMGIFDVFYNVAESLVKKLKI